ncbi:MAG TPA: hypothetical protein VFZ09_01260 [Archangium sp.]|uniref:hypothetical protein n=1 Tax=Archangium sp. TaxID=1872627 RepID=UPI002E2FA961|nr:hypothetical protein [Archangium sp.]HEX5744837.1 hypothetical protein [Archangium sp.]
MPKRATALARAKPCLGMSPSCDCNMCVESRRKRLQVAAMVEQRYRDGLLFDQLQGLLRQEPPHRFLPPADATVSLQRAEGEKTLVDFWRELEQRQHQEKRDIASLRTLARRCGFALSVRLVRRTAVRQLKAVVACPEVLSLLGDTVFTTTSLGDMRELLEAAIYRALQVERRCLDEAAREFGFVITETKARRGLRGSWTACSVEGAVPLHADTPAELRRLMREAANASAAPHVATGPVGDELPHADPADVTEEHLEPADQRTHVRQLLNVLLTEASRSAKPRAAARKARGRRALVEVEASV